MSNKIRKHFIFSGYVQGVGFRYHSSYMARDLGLTGWVKNEYDGSVVMEVQGEEALIDRLIIALNNDRYIEIQNIESKTIKLDEEERNFKVKM